MPQALHGGSRCTPRGPVATVHDACQVPLLCEFRLTLNHRYPQSPAIYHAVVNSILNVRKLLLRHLMLPRPYFLRSQWIEATPQDPNGHYFLFDYLAHPWYVKPSFMHRWGPRA